MRDDTERLLDILEAIERIEKYAVYGYERFERDELVQTWIIHYVQIVGEATAQLSDELCSANPQVPWRQIVAMRNILVHVYSGVDPNEVWVVVERDIPILRVQVQAILQAQGASD